MTSLQRNMADAVTMIQSLRGLEGPLRRATALIVECLSAGGKLIVCGNGGSAADASHFATEFVSRFVKERRPYPAIALSDFGSTLTAIGNDYAFEEVFARQIGAFAQAGDVLVVFTTSGKSRNVLRALEEAKARGLGSVAFLGKGGGYTAGVASVELMVPGDSTARIQEAHKLLLHTLCEDVEKGLGHG